MWPYVTLVRSSRSLGLVTSSVVGRLPIGMLSLALVLHVRTTTGSYAAAGAAAAGYALGAGAGSPLLGRLADRFGQRRVLIATGILDALPLVVLVTIARRPVQGVPAVVLATATGLLTPPLTACIRASWLQLVHPAEEVDRAYALDAVLTELIYLLGPLVVAATVAISSPATAILLAAFLGGIGSVTYATFPASRDKQPEPGAVRHPSALRTPGIRVVVTTLLVWSIAFGVLDVAVTAFATLHGRPESAGVLLSVFAVGGIAGGLWYGARVWRRSAAQRHVLGLATYTLGLVPLVFSSSIAAMLPLITIAGLGLASVASPAYRLIPELAPPGTHTEAYGWIELALAVGLGIGALVAGWLVDAVGVRWALSMAPTASAIAIVVAALRRSNVEPRLRAP